MSTSTEEMQKVLTQYFEAWQNQDSQSLVELFDEGGIYRVKPFGVEEYHGKREIKEYWEEHPVNGQINPRPRLLYSAFGNNLCFAEWENTFVNKLGKNKKTQGMLILEFKNWLNSGTSRTLSSSRD